MKGPLSHPTMEDALCYKDDKLIKPMVVKVSVAGEEVPVVRYGQPATLDSKQFEQLARRGNQGVLVMVSMAEQSLRNRGIWSLGGG